MNNFSTTNHSFSVELSVRYGIEEAILIHHFQHWIKYNRRLGRNLHEGKWWTYQTKEEIAGHFPYWSQEKIRRYLESLIDKKILVTGNFNKTKFDRTLWYAFSDEENFIGSDENSSNFYDRRNCPIDGSETPNQSVQNNRPIPHTITDTKKEEREGASPQPPPPPDYSKEFFKEKRVVMRMDRYKTLLKDFGEAKVAEMTSRLDEYADINPKRFKQYACHAAVIRKWIREDNERKKSMPASKVQTNQEWAKNVINNFKNINDMHVGNEGISFSSGQSYVVIKFSENGFKEQVLNRLRKMGLKTEGL